MNRYGEQGSKKSFAVLGLGSFGLSIVETLSGYDVDILACDREEDVLHRVQQMATRILQVDLSSEEALKTLGLGNFDAVILCMGEEFEASVIATMVAKEQGAARVIAKARTKRQGKILSGVGADEVVLPEHLVGERMAKRLLGLQILNVLDNSDIYTVSEMTPMDAWIGKTIKEADIRNRQGILILGIRSKKGVQIPADLDRVLAADDVLITFSER